MDLPSTEAVPSQVARVITLIEQDIRRQGLRPGDTYMTTRELATKLRISSNTVNAAMETLAGRNLLVRRKRLGTLVGPAALEDEGGVLRCVHCIASESRFEHQRPLYDALIDALHVRFSGAGIQLNLIPDRQSPLSFARKLTHYVKQHGLVHGVVALDLPGEVCHLLADEHLPAVLCGTVEEGVSLPSIDIDHAKTGETIARYAIEHGHRHLAALMGRIWGEGDNAFVASLNSVLNSSDGDFMPLTIRSNRDDPKVIVPVVTAMMRPAPHRPTAFICRSRIVADAIIQVADFLELRVPEDICVVLSDRYEGDPLAARYPSVVPSLTFVQQAEQVAAMLAELAQGDRVDPPHVRMLPELILPERDRPMADPDEDQQ